MVNQSFEPVSTQVSRIVPSAKVAEFEALLHEVITVARGFEGHLGVDVLRPEGGGTYQVIFRYRGHAEHEAWMGSDQRRRLVARIDELLDDSTGAAVRTVDGWEGWFVTPGYAPPAPPQRWKMAVITLVALYPIVLGLLTGLRPLTGGWPLPVGMLLTMALTIPLMTWVVMPALTTRLGPWLRK
ncbi:MAG: antibiotic biosynthesis monooxygenase [Candidatus Limnocylindria bacterium]